MNQPSASKRFKTHKLSVVPGTAESEALDLVSRIRERVDGAAAAGVITRLAALRLHADLRQTASLRRLLMRRRRAPLAGRA